MNCEDFEINEKELLEYGVTLTKIRSDLELRADKIMEMDEV